MTSPTDTPTPGTAVATRADATADPYDHTDERNHLAVHQVNEKALALASPLGKILLTGESEFLMICRASGIPAERMVLELVSVARRKPEILQCTPESIMSFMFDAAKLGLQIGRGIFPVPLKNRTTGKRTLEAWVGYKGNKQLVIEGGSIRDCWAQVVYEGDEFEFTRLPVPNVLRHKEGPNFGDMRKAEQVYAIGLYANGQTRAVLLSEQDVMKRKAKNPSSNDNGSPWQTHPREMWQAKAILALTSDMPQGGLSQKLAHMRAMIERGEVQPAHDTPTLISLPAAALIEPEPEEMAAAPQPLSVGEASSVPIPMKGGATRLVSEIRNEGLERIREQARALLDKAPDDLAMQRVAEACTVVLDARASGEAKEPPKREGN